MHVSWEGGATHSIDAIRGWRVLTQRAECGELMQPSQETIHGSVVSEYTLPRTIRCQEHRISPNLDSRRVTGIKNPHNIANIASPTRASIAIAQRENGRSKNRSPLPAFPSARSMRYLVNFRFGKKRPWCVSLDRYNRSSRLSRSLSLIILSKDRSRFGGGERQPA